MPWISQRPNCVYHSMLQMIHGVSIRFPFSSYALRVPFRALLTQLCAFSFGYFIYDMLVGCGRLWMGILESVNKAAVCFVMICGKDRLWRFIHSCDRQRLQVIISWHHWHWSWPWQAPQRPLSRFSCQVRHVMNKGQRVVFIEERVSELPTCYWYRLGSPVEELSTPLFNLGWRHRR